MKGFSAAAIRRIGLLIAIPGMEAGAAYVTAGCWVGYAALAKSNRNTDKDGSLKGKVSSSSLASDSHSQWQLNFCSTDREASPTTGGSDGLSLSETDSSGYPRLIMGGARLICVSVDANTNGNAIIGAAYTLTSSGRERAETGAAQRTIEVRVK